MFIQTTRQVNARTFDGRVYAAGEGAITEIDDGDEGMVAMAKSLISSGQAVHYGDAGTVGDEPPAPPVDSPDNKTEGVVVPNDPEAELDQLRAQAEAAGVKVDGRLGADRLREEIQAAEAADE